MKKLFIVILAHDNRECLEEMVENVRFYCPKATIGLYNAGDDPHLGKGLPVRFIKPRRRLYYARITPFFLDLFLWLCENGVAYDYVTNVDSDVLFIRHGFEKFVDTYMSGYDYMAPDLRFNVQMRPQWRPMKSLRPELKKWYEFLGFNYMNGAFNPGQTFSRRYINNLITHPSYRELQDLVAQNKSFTLHEVLFPTLVDFLGLQGCSYPKELNQIIRYRPYQAVSGIQRALSINTAFFVHPVRRELNDPARVFIKNNMEKDGQV